VWPPTLDRALDGSGPERIGQVAIDRTAPNRIAVVNGSMRLNPINEFGGERRTGVMRAVLTRRLIWINAAIRGPPLEIQEAARRNSKMWASVLAVAVAGAASMSVVCCGG
jgi:hypothetical protein